MTAENSNVIILPVIRIERDSFTATRTIKTESAVDRKLRVAAKRAGCKPENFAEALIVYGLALMERRDPKEFYECLRDYDEEEEARPLFDRMEQLRELQLHNK